MRLSIITPVHFPVVPFLGDTYQSLRDQSVTDWEWLILLNHGGTVPAEIEADGRVRVFYAPPTMEGIGALKYFACTLASGDVLVELDADDMLTPDALEALADTFADASVHMAYSNSAEFSVEADGSWKPRVYGAEYGWRDRPFEYKGHALKEQMGWPASAHMMRFIFWAPNHVRAWRRTSYFRVGGHDASLMVADDHDLCCRFYIAHGSAGVRHIDRCLYLYRLRADNSHLVFNAEIQTATERLYLKYSRDLAARWSHDEALDLLDLGGRFNAWPGFQTVDQYDADLTVDLNGKWPFSDNSVGVIKAYHIFEHLRDPIHTMNEAFRVLAPGGWLFIEVPSTDGRGAFQDPTHVSFWNANSFWYYTNEAWARFIRPRFSGRFQVSRIVDYYPGEFERTHLIPYTQADLICLKPPYSDRPVGLVTI